MTGYTVLAGALIFFFTFYLCNMVWYSIKIREAKR